MKNDLLLEIGMEELPASYMERGAASFKKAVLSLLDDNNITHGSCQSFVTPRRISLLIRETAAAEEDRVEKMTGPPRKVCEKEGQFTKAYEKFLEKYDLNNEDIRWEKTDRGEYLAADVKIKGKKRDELLRDSLEEILGGLDFPKRMRWDESGFLFPRPVRWIVALGDDKVIDIEAAGVRSGRVTSYLRNGAVTSGEIADPDDYLRKMAENRIIIDPAERERIIREGIDSVMKEAGADSYYTEELINEVSGLTEYPLVLKGRFHEKYLKLPAKVISAAMSQHQRYFSLYKGEELLPLFVFVANGYYEDASQIIAGNEMVLRARLDDAMFYWNEDTSRTPEELRELLDNITWMEGLGSLKLKTDRVRQLASLLVKDDPLALDAARFSKIDIPSEMIKDGKEFTKLQGTIAKYYLLEHGAGEELAEIVEQHYWPKVWGDKLPGEKAAAISIADKSDNITGAFIKGLIPSGTKDPYALRRQANSIIAIILGYEDGSVDFSRGLHVEDVNALFAACAKLYPSEALDENVLNQIGDFFEERVKSQLKALDMPYDIVDAVCDTPGTDIRVRYEKASAFKRLSTKPEFREVASTFRRVNNIVKKAREKVDMDSLSVDVSLFREAGTRDMHEAWKKTASAIDNAGNDYEKIFDAIIGFKMSVDSFFDSVMVMDEDTRLRDNRLALLAEITARFGEIVNFDHIVVG